MSYPGVDPAESTSNPVGTQELPAGHPLANPDFKAQSESMHEAALNGGQPTAIAPEDLKRVVTEAVSDMFAVSDAWKVTERIRFIIECPSGQKCLAKHMTTMDLINADLVEEMDFFSKRLFPTSFDEQGNPVDDDDDSGKGVWSMLRDIKRRQRFFDLLNRMLEIGIIKPRVINDGAVIKTDENGKETVAFGKDLTIDEQIALLGKPIPPLKEGEVYGSTVDFGDKMAIFSELNKPLSQVTPFREESETVLANLESVPSVESSTE